MNVLKKLILLFSFSLFVAAPMVTVALPTASYAVTAADVKCEKRILGLPTWHRGLTDTECNIIPPNEAQPDGLSSFIWKIVLNVIEMGLFIVIYIAVFFIIFGGFQFLTGGSSPAQVEKARKTILNAVIGLVISIGSIGIVNLMFRIING